MLKYQGREHFEEIQKEKLDKARSIIAKSTSDKILKNSLLSYEVKPHRLVEWHQAIEEAESLVGMGNAKRVENVLEKQLVSAAQAKPSHKRKIEGGFFGGVVYWFFVGWCLLW